MNKLDANAIAAAHGTDALRDAFDRGVAELPVKDVEVKPPAALADYEFVMNGHVAIADAPRQPTAVTIRKVVDFESPEAFKKMGDDICAMSLRTPMAADDIAELVVNAGQAGVATKDPLEFAKARCASAWPGTPPPARRARRWRS